jgi:hypothetical protein
LTSYLIFSLSFFFRQDCQWWITLDRRPRR